jgi:hypothetical protein
MKKKKKQSDLEFDASRVDEEALSPLPSPLLGPPDARKRDEIDDDSSTPTPSGEHHRMVSSSDFSTMQILRMRDLLSPLPSLGTSEPATIEEHSPLVLVLPDRPRFGSISRTDSLLTDDNNDDGDDDDDDDDDDATDTRTFLGAHSILTGTRDSFIGGTESIIEGAKTIIADIEDATQEAWADYEDKRHYDWREDWKGGGILKFMRWLATGAGGSSKQNDDEIQENLNSLARLLSLLREYHDRFGMPEKGGPKDQEYVLREVTRDLYFGGAPIWVLEPVMKKVAEGLTGKKGVDFFMLPRRAFIFAPSSGATSMFEITRGYDMQRLDSMESVACRLASFASNTSSSNCIPARWPRPQELRRAFRAESVAGEYNLLSHPDARISSLCCHRQF